MRTHALMVEEIKRAADQPANQSGSDLDALRKRRDALRTVCLSTFFQFLGLTPRVKGKFSAQPGRQEAHRSDARPSRGALRVILVAFQIPVQQECSPDDESLAWLSIGENDLYCLHRQHPEDSVQLLAIYAPPMSAATPGAAAAVDIWQAHGT